MLYRSKAPLRIGLAGGGSDVSPYSDIYGGAILNTTISLYAHANIQELDVPKIRLESLDRKEYEEYDLSEELPVDGNLDLAKGVYNRLVKDFKFPLRGFHLSTYVDVPAGSGLGTSSTLVVAILGAFMEWLHLPLGSYDIAQLAYRIERSDLQMAGGKQDQYAATFGGVNYMEFYADNKVIVNPLRIEKKHLLELENNLLLFYTETSHVSSDIIKEQQRNVKENKQSSVEAMHVIKEQAKEIKEALLTGHIHRIGIILDEGFEYKKQMAKSITTPLIEEIYYEARKAGALGGKISGAGGGGFMVFYCSDNHRFRVIEALRRFNGYFTNYKFVKEGLFTWSI
ncbi:dehydrogenase [Parabacteroides sp. Marseille-P3160]|uniref:GHMP family kinase ATP-binding protein n=1 Tax=Parabacteroides sp. Marseille-P3160 TaxID=1917887 RepID=UPI0009B9BEC7|nr:dehydrogenase [Parabacteroides sp. Marseille-P3160]